MFLALNGPPLENFDPPHVRSWIDQCHRKSTSWVTGPRASSRSERRSKHYERTYCVSVWVSWQVRRNAGDNLLLARLHIQGGPTKVIPTDVILLVTFEFDDFC